MTELSDWKRIIYEPEKARYERDIVTLTARIKALETGLGEIIAQCGGNQTPSLTQPRVDAHCFLSHDLMAIEHLARNLLTQGEKG